MIPRKETEPTKEQREAARSQCHGVHRINSASDDCICDDLADFLARRDEARDADWKAIIAKMRREIKLTVDQWEYEIKEGRPGIVFGSRMGQLKDCLKTGFSSAPALLSQPAAEEPCGECDPCVNGNQACYAASPEPVVHMIDAEEARENWRSAEEHLKCVATPCDADCVNPACHPGGAAPAQPAAEKCAKCGQREPIGIGMFGNVCRECVSALAAEEGAKPDDAPKMYSHDCAGCGEGFRSNDPNHTHCVGCL